MWGVATTKKGAPSARRRTIERSHRDNLNFKVAGIVAAIMKPPSELFARLRFQSNILISECHEKTVPAVFCKFADSERNMALGLELVGLDQCEMFKNRFVRFFFNNLSIQYCVYFFIDSILLSTRKRL